MAGINSACGPRDGEPHFLLLLLLLLLRAHRVLPVRPCSRCCGINDYSTPTQMANTAKVRHLLRTADQFAMRDLGNVTPPFPCSGNRLTF